MAWRGAAATRCPHGPLVNRLRWLRTSKLMADLILVDCDGGHHDCHSGLFAAMSPGCLCLAETAALEHETVLRALRLPLISGPAVEALLDFCYTGDLGSV